MKGPTANLHPALIARLVQLEAHLKREITITSGYRTVAQNASVGGVTNSEHTYRPAQGVDILCTHSTTRYKMLVFLLSRGVSRIGIGKDFIHIGIADDKPQRVCWLD